MSSLNKVALKLLGVLLMAITFFAYGGQTEVDVCHMTGAVDWGGGDVPVGRVIKISESYYQAHIDHGDPESWEVVTLNDGSEVCLDKEYFAAAMEQMVDLINVFESDSDADGVQDMYDACHDTLPGEAVDEQGCSVGDICPCKYPWKNHGEFVNCVTKTSQAFVKAGLISNKEKSDYVSAAAKNECTLTSGLGDANSTNYGDPRHPAIKPVNDTFEITFAITGDPQFHNMYDQGGVDCGWMDNAGNSAADNLLTSQITVSEMNKACKNAVPECMGAFVAGDITHLRDVQSIIAFRQLFEYGYPGHDGGSILCHSDTYYHRYSWGTKLNYPMFTLIGNHGDPTDPDGSLVLEYINDLVKGPELYEFPIEKRVSGTAPASFYKGNYAWEWGSFNFISLGLWAFSDPVDSHLVDQDKIDWLKEYLASVGHERAIVLFQHYGWDHFSLDGWWSSDNSHELINVLCNRDSWGDDCGTDEKPRYNIIGVFSGHTHVAKHHNIYTNDEQTGVTFDNYIVNDAGPGGNELDEDGNCPGDCSTGYTMVHLNVWPAGTDRHADNQMTVTNYNLENFKFSSEYGGHGDGENKTTFTRVAPPDPAPPYIKQGITSGLTTWDRGEPNGGKFENCAAFKSNGRFNDLDCGTHLRFVCRQIESDQSTLHLLSAEDIWHRGERACIASGEQAGTEPWVFSLPQSFEEQAYLLNLIIDSGDNTAVWMDYSDQIDEGHWISWPMDLFYFAVGQPDDGSQLQGYKGHGEDCAVLSVQGLIYGRSELEDRRCENEVHHYVCRDHNGWYIHPERGMWKQGFDEDKCGEGGFVFPANVHEFDTMVADVKPYLVDNYMSAWVAFNDIMEEGNWVTVHWKNKCWGQNNNHQADLPSDTFRQLTNGDDFTCGIKLDGKVECWGNSADGRLNAPADDIFLQIDAGANHTCGVLSDQKVVCWGLDDSGNVDHYSNYSDFNFRQVIAGTRFSCGEKTDGLLVCWGELPTTTAPSGIFQQIDGKYDRICGVRAELYPNQFEGYWKMDEDSGTTAADFSANLYNGTLENSPTWSSDTAPTNFDNSNSLRFDRADSDYVSIPGTYSLSQLSLSTWVKLTSTPGTASTTTYMRFITLGGEKAVLRYVDYDGTGKLQFYMKIDDSFHSIVVDYPWGTDTWYHVAGTYDGSTMRLYLNGVEQGKREVSGTLTTGNGVVLSGGGETLDGLLDDVRITGWALSPNDIRALAVGDPGIGMLDCWPAPTGDVYPPTGVFRQVTTGDEHACGLRKDGKVECWGSNQYNQLDVPSAIFSQIDAGGTHTCGLQIMSPEQSEGYWKLDEGSGMIVADSTANGHDGTLSGPTWSSDTAPTNFYNSSSLHFDQAHSDMLRIDGATNIGNLQQLSLSTWVKLTNLNLGRFVTLGGDKAALGADYWSEVPDPGVQNLHFKMTDDSGTSHYVRKKVAMSTDSWIHVAGTYDGSTMRLYLNGLQVGHTNAKFTPRMSVPGYDDYVILGMGLKSGLDGLLDDVQIHGWALSPDDIEALAKGKQHGSGGTLVCWGSDDNENYQLLNEPSGTWDQVSSGGNTSCATERFIRPWEDDFADGHNYTENFDCAGIVGYNGPDGEHLAKFVDVPCEGGSNIYACRSVETGQWEITQRMDDSGWEDGFDVCELDNKLFDSPKTEAGYERLVDIMWEGFGADRIVNVNYSDARIEGQWRPAYWEDWKSGYPVHTPHYHHVVLDVAEDGWMNVSETAASVTQGLCDFGANNYYELTPLGDWRDAYTACIARGAVLVKPGNETHAAYIKYWMEYNKVSRIWIRFTNDNGRDDYPWTFEDWWAAD